MSEKQLSIIILLQDITTTAQLSEQALAANEIFLQRGFTQKMCTWGNRISKGKSYSFFFRLFQLVNDIYQIYLETKKNKYDVMLIHTHPDIKTVFRELFLILFVRNKVKTIILYTHGSASNLLDKKGHILFKIFASKLLHKIDGVGLLSTQEICEWKRFYKNGKYFLLSNPYSINDEAQMIIKKTRNDQRGKIEILFVGRLLKEKGVYEIIDSIDELRKEIPNIHLSIVGDGPEFTNIQEKISSLDLCSEISLVGEIKHPEIFNYYKNSDLFVFPGHGPEGFPTVLSESMVSGLPIITTPVYGIKDRLKENINCLFVEPKSPTQIAEAISRLINDPELYREIRENNLEEIKKYSPSIISNQLIDQILLINEKNCF